MKRVYVYCEGQTEKQFVDIVLKQYMQNKGLEMTPTIAGDGRKSKRGGISGYAQAKRELQRLCHEHRNETVTTMIDLAPNFGKEFTCPRRSLHE